MKSKEKTPSRSEPTALDSEELLAHLSVLFDDIFWMQDLSANRMLYVSPNCERILF